MTAPRLPASVDEVVEQISEVLNLPPGELSARDDLFIVGLDSLRLMLLTDRWASVGAVLDPVDLLEDPTPAGVWEAIKNAQAEGAQP